MANSTGRRTARPLPIASGLLLVLLAASCARREAPPAPTAAPPPAPPVQPQPEVQLCPQLRAILAAEPGGFTGLRGQPTGERQWIGRVVPPGLRSCQVEGDFYPIAEYNCLGMSTPGADGDVLAADFAWTARAIGACLAGPGWEGRGWQDDGVVQLMGGERQQVWRNGGTRHRPAVSLKVEENFDSGRWYLRLSTYTMR